MPEAPPAPAAPAPAKPSGPGKLGLTRPPSGGLKPTLKPKLGLGKKGNQVFPSNPSRKPQG